MRLFVQSGWRQPDLSTLNACQMFLHAFLLSNIVDGSGKGIITSCWDHPQPLDSPYIWPRMHPPPTVSWGLWHTALTNSLHLGRNQHLALLLSKWFAQNSLSGWYYHPGTNSLWRYGHHQWIRHGGIPQHTRQCSFHNQGESFPPPPIADLHKATMAHCGRKIILTGSEECK